MNVPNFISSSVVLAPYTTLGIGGRADFFCTALDEATLRMAIAWAKDASLPITILGGGSNVLVSDGGVRGLVIKMALKNFGSALTGDRVHVTVGAGYEWDDFVLETVTRGWWGLENLSAIPGTVGATPVQNVGAYGVEVVDHIDTVTVFDTESETIKILTNAECQFGYRDSIFKKPAGKNFVVTSVTFSLSCKPRPLITYKDLALYFSTNESPTLFDIRQAVISIRSKKFPDWHVLGTAGSFFKNPSVSPTQFSELKEKYPALPGYSNHEGTSVKLALGWILDQVLNKKGYRVENVSLYTEQALVLVNHGGATAHEVFNFSERICAEVYKETGITIEREVGLIGEW